MRQLTQWIALCVCWAFLTACLETSEKTLTPSTDQQKQAYSVGTQIGSSVKRNIDQIASVEESFDIDMFLQGLEDAVKETQQLPADELSKISSQFHQDFSAKFRARQTAEASENLGAGKDFLADNAKRTGVVQTESGLQYRILQEGGGAKPAATDTVKVHYTGTLIDGTKFDSSVDRGEPAQFPLNGVITGWTEGLQLMQEGAKYEFFIPPELAYGATPRSTIPANSTLVFEVELIEVIKQETPAN